MICFHISVIWMSYIIAISLCKRKYSYTYFILSCRFEKVNYKIKCFIFIKVKLDDGQWAFTLLAVFDRGVNSSRL